MTYFLLIYFLIGILACFLWAWNNDLITISQASGCLIFGPIIVFAIVLDIFERNEGHIIWKRKYKK